MGTNQRINGRTNFGNKFWQQILATNFDDKFWQLFFTLATLATFFTLVTFLALKVIWGPTNGRTNFGDELWRQILATNFGDEL
jgi:hypothetical protein